MEIAQPCLEVRNYATVSPRRALETLQPWRCMTIAYRLKRKSLFWNADLFVLKISDTGVLKSRMERTPMQYFGAQQNERIYV